MTALRIRFPVLEFVRVEMNGADDVANHRKWRCERSALVQFVNLDCRKLDSDVDLTEQIVESSTYLLAHMQYILHVIANYMPAFTCATALDISPNFTHCLRFTPTSPAHLWNASCSLSLTPLLPHGRPFCCGSYVSRDTISLVIGRPGYTEAVIRGASAAGVDLEAGAFVIGPELPDVSATLARQALRDGDLDTAAQLLHPDVLDWHIQSGFDYTLLDTNREPLTDSR